MNIHTGDLKTELLFTKLQLKDAKHKLEYYTKMVKSIEDRIEHQEALKKVINRMKK